MKEFKISEKQLQQLGEVLLEFPARKVLNSLDLIRNLPLIEAGKSESLENID